MVSVSKFFSYIWTVHRPSWEKETAGDPEPDKPPATLPTAKDVDPETDINEPNAKQMGVAIAEASYAETGWSWYFIMIALLVAYFVNSFDNGTMYVYQQDAFNQAFHKFTMYPTSSTVGQVVLAVAKLIVAKMADVFGRATGFMIVTFFYVIGFIIQAVAQNDKDMIGGVAVQSFGNSGLQIMIWISIADYMSARLRAMGIGVVALPYVIVFGIGPPISAAVVSSNWRWGPGMFTILVPVAVLPIIMMLLYHQHKAKRQGLIPPNPYARHGVFFAVKQFLLDVDIIGLLMILGGFLMLLLALNQGAILGWSTHWVIGLLVVGGVLILAAPLFEYFLSPRPIIRREWLNSDVVLAMMIGFFDFISYYISFGFLSYWANITLDMPLTDMKTQYFTQTPIICLTVFGALAGVLVMFMKRYKWLMVFGTIIRIVCYGLMIRYRTASTTTVQAVWPQVLQGLGGGFMGVILQTAAQVTVRHQDVAMVTSVVLLFSELGGSVGSAIWGAIQADQFPKILARNMPNVSPTDIMTIVSSPTTALDGFGTTPGTFPRGTPGGDAIIASYNEVVRKGLIAAIVFSAVPFLCALFLRDWVLPKSNNVMSKELPEKNFLKLGTDDTYAHAIQTDHAGEFPLDEGEKKAPLPEQ
ncbi:hypothetical protein MSPP1_002340 [Malassezia sp. CBS 17886]|nr:hypothetical protein MSPP1_002340 [Malassezia sp. CBS 17886]